MKTFLPAELIKKKKRGETHSSEEINFIVQEFTHHRFPDYQLAAWLMAVCFQGMTQEETSHLTAAMRDSGKVLDFSSSSHVVVDKHSTGGVGDKTSLIVGPIAAAAGVPIAMIAGRGLGHTGGTLDKLESIPGFSVNISLHQFQKNVLENRLAIIGQTEEICPADRLIYRLRDVTGTIDSLPLICSSIMSKKLAEGLGGLVLDVKFGSGAFMKKHEQARELAHWLQIIGKHNHLPVTTLLTNMNQPLGQFIGNALEVRECLEILKGHTSPLFDDTIILSIELAAWMIYMGKKTTSIESARELAKIKLMNGEAHQQFCALCERQGAVDLNHLPVARHIFEINAKQDGFVAEINTEIVGVAAVILGAGRKTTNDSIDPSVGIECLIKIGTNVRKNQTIYKVHGNEKDKINVAKELLLQATKIDPYPPKPLILIDEVRSEC